MPRLPVPGSDDGQWGEILNAFLRVVHNDDGTLKTPSIPVSDKGEPDGVAELDGSGKVPTGQLPDAALVGDATPTQKGIIQLAGDLDNTASVPRVANGAITNAKVSDTADIAQNKIANLTSDLDAKVDVSGDIMTGDLTLSGAGSQILFPDTGTNAGGLLMGGDTNLYRSGANTLTTDDNFVVGGGVLQLGADTSLYRSATDAIRTNDNLIVLPTSHGAGLYKYGLQVDNAPAGVTARTIGVLTFATIGDSSLTSEYAAGLEGRVISNASGTIPTAYGLNFSIENRSTGTMTSAVGVNASVGNYTTGSGTITHAYGARLTVNQTGNGSGVITNGYGLYIADVNATANSWGIYQLGADDLNYFGGYIGLGTTGSINSRLTFATSTSAAGGILFGTDTNLYRSAANTLRTDDSYIVGGDLIVNTSRLATATNGTNIGVGIGTASPASATPNRVVLHMNDTTGNGLEHRLNSTTLYARMYNNNAEFGFGTDTAHAIRFFVGGGGNSALQLNTDLSINTFGRLQLTAATTARASLNIASGATPTAPANGDMWFDGTDLKIRIGGITRTVTVA